MIACLAVLFEKLCWLRAISKQQDFLDVLNFYWQPPENQTPAYDFVHLPWKKCLGHDTLTGQLFNFVSL